MIVWSASWHTILSPFNKNKQLLVLWNVGNNAIIRVTGFILYVSGLVLTTGTAL